MTCPCNFTSEHQPWSAPWHRDHRAHHLAVFPAVDDLTKQNLDTLVALAEEKKIVPRSRGRRGVI